MAGASSDRNLLFGVLALQMDFISREALIAAVSAWVLDKGRPLEEILVEQGAMSASRRAMLEPLVSEHIKAHDNDPQKSLAAVSSIDSVREELGRVADPEVHASLAAMSSIGTRYGDTYATKAPSVGITTSSGLRFRILRPHDKGGLGIVSVAHDEELHREVALKEIQDRHSDDPEQRSRFLLEAEITGGLEHPGIIPVYGLGHYEDGRPFYAMRFIRGDSLKHAIARFHKVGEPAADPATRAMQMRELLGRFVDVCNAMAYAHSRGVLHRDIKPGNIMLGPFGETLVVDWGLAKPIGGPETPLATGETKLKPRSMSSSAATMMGSAVGTPAFMSPEQAEGKLDQLGPASDVYSLGATLYQLLTGRVAFEDTDIGVVLQKVIRGDFPSPRRISPSTPKALDAICVKAMAVRVEDRYVSPLDLAEDIKSWMAGEPVTAYKEPWIDRASRWARRHKTPVAGAASLMATGVVALIIGLILLGREKVRTEHQRDLADKNFRQARQAVDDYLTRVGEDPQLALPGLQPLRRRLLEAALIYYKDFAARGVEEDRGRLADAQIRAGRINDLIGSRQDALTSFGEAVAVREELARSKPTDPSEKANLAAALEDLGTVQLALGRAAESLRSFERASEIRETLARDHPGDGEALAAQAKGLSSLGNWYHKAGDLPKALEKHRSALELYDKVAVLDPKSPQPKSDLARGLTDRGIILAEARRFDEALGDLRRARDIREGLVRESSTNSALLKDLADNHHFIAAILHSVRRLDEAMASFILARDAREGLVAANTVLQYQDDLAKDHEDIGTLLIDAGRVAEALPAHEKAREIRSQLVRFHPGLPDLLRGLAESDISIGRVNAAGKRPAEALKSFREARDLFAKLALGNLQEAGYRLQQASACESMGNLDRSVVPADEALRLHQEGRELREALVREHPDDVQYQNALSNSFTNLGVLRGATGHAGEAIDLFRQARDIRLKVVALRPDDLNTRSTLGIILENLGAWFEKTNQGREALEAFRQAVDQQSTALGKAPGEVRYRRFLALHYQSLTRVQRSLGLADEAAAASLERQKLWPDDPEALFQSARELALCIPLDGRGDADRFAVPALDALRRAADRGLVDLRRLEEDADLKALRSRDDFKRLLEAIREKTKAAPKSDAASKPQD